MIYELTKEMKGDRPNWRKEVGLSTRMGDVDKSGAGVIGSLEIYAN